MIPFDVPGYLAGREIDCDHVTAIHARSADAESFGKRLAGQYWELQL